MDNDYEVPIPYQPGTQAERIKKNNEEEENSSDSDFMDVKRIRPPLPDTMPVKFDSKSATIFVPVSSRAASNSRLEKRRLTAPDQHHLNGSANLRRAVSFASSQTNSVLRQPSRWDEPVSPLGNSPPYPDVEVSVARGDNLNRATSMNSMAYVVNVKKPEQPKYPSFVKPTAHRGAVVGRSKTFNETDRHRVTGTNHVNVQLRPLTDRSSSARLNVQQTTRATLRDSAIDLISDEEDSEAYAAVSLAGTLSRNVEQMKTPKSHRHRHLIIAVAVLSIFVVILIAAVVTVMMLKLK